MRRKAYSPFVSTVRSQLKAAKEKEKAMKAYYAGLELEKQKDIATIQRLMNENAKLKLGV